MSLVAGKIAEIVLVNGETIEPEDIKHIITAGKDDSSISDDMRYRLLARTIKNPDELFQSPFLRLIWYNPNPNSLPWPDTTHTRPDLPLEVDFISRTLNQSQEDAANVALQRDNQNRITLLIGPPGSGLDFTFSFSFRSNINFSIGKTTVIAAIVDTLIQETEEETIWVVAQSNIAVKNIAEKLHSCDFKDFRLLVSGEFIFDW